MNKKISIQKNKTKVTSWSDIKNELLTEHEQKVLEIRVRIRQMLRKLKEKRQELNITQQELADEANLPRTTITKIETGYQNVSVLKLMQVADAMDMELEINLVPKK